MCSDFLILSQTFCCPGTHHLNQQKLHNNSRRLIQIMITGHPLTFSLTTFKNAITVFFSFSIFLTLYLVIPSCDTYFFLFFFFPSQVFFVPFAIRHAPFCDHSFCSFMPSISMLHCPSSLSWNYLFPEHTCFKKSRRHGRINRHFQFMIYLDQVLWEFSDLAFEMSTFQVVFSVCLESSPMSDL